MKQTHWYTASFILHAPKQRRNGALLGFLSAALLLCANLSLPTYKIKIDFIVDFIEINLYKLTHNLSTLTSEMSALAYYMGVDIDTWAASFAWVAILLILLPLIQAVLGVFTLNVFGLVGPVCTLACELIIYSQVCSEAPGISSYLHLGSGFWVTLLAVALQLIAILIGSRAENSNPADNGFYPENGDDEGRNDATGLLNNPPDPQMIPIAATLLQLNTNRSYGVPENSSVILGRDPSKVDIAIDNPTVGRVHTVITSLNGKLLVEDLDSSNGTYVGDTRLEPRKPVEVHEGDYVTVSNEIFQIQHT